MSSDPQLTPTQELMKIAMIGALVTWRCRHCAGIVEMRHDPRGEAFPYVLEHFHERGCPDDEDSHEAAVAEVE